MAWRSCIHRLDGFRVYEAGSLTPGGDLPSGVTLSAGPGLRGYAAMRHWVGGTVLGACMLVFLLW